MKGLQMPQPATKLIRWDLGVKKLIEIYIEYNPPSQHAIHHQDY